MAPCAPRLSAFVGGALAFVVPLLIAATAAEDSMFRFPLPQVVIWPLLAAIGGVIATVASFRITKLYKSARLAARAGYGWGTIAEVLVDDRHDTGALIAGEKEYAALSPERRDHFRRTRIVREALRLGAGLWMVTGFFVGLPLAVRWAGSPSVLVLWALGIPLAMLGTSALLEAREASALSRVRRRAEPVKKQVDRLSGLAASWRQSFEQLMSAGRRMGQGLFGWRKRIRALVEIAGVVVVAASFFSVVVMLPAHYRTGFLDISPVPSEDATKQYQDIIRMKRYAAPIDASVTPVRAGQALHDISLAGGRPPRSRFERRAVVVIPKIRQIKQPWGPFTKNWIDRGAMDQARHGLTPAQRQFLIDAANEPGLSEFHVVASAASVDFLSAAVVQPLPPTFNQWMIPSLDARAIEPVAYSRIAQAALDLANGRPAVAERSLREVISFGFVGRGQPLALGRSRRNEDPAASARESRVAVRGDGSLGRSRRDRQRRHRGDVVLRLHRDLGHADDARGPRDSAPAHHHRHHGADRTAVGSGDEARGVRAVRRFAADDFRPRQIAAGSLRRGPAGAGEVAQRRHPNAAGRECARDADCAGSGVRHRPTSGIWARARPRRDDRIAPVFRLSDKSESDDQVRQRRMSP